MDRNAITGMILITVLMVVYYTFFVDTSQMEQRNASNTPTTEMSQEADTLPQEEMEVPVEEQLGSAQGDTDSLKQAVLLQEFSDFAPLAAGEGKLISIKTDELSVNIDTKGAFIRSAYLNGHRTYDSLQLPIFTDNPENDFSFDFTYNNKRRSINSRDLLFTLQSPGESFSVTGEDSLQLVFRAAIDESRYIDQIFTFKGQGFGLNYEINMVGLKNALKSSTYVLNWVSHLPRTELAVKNMRDKTTIAYDQSGDFDNLSATESSAKEELRNGFINWISFKSQFFSQIIVADEPFRTADLQMVTPITEDVNKVLASSMVINATPSDNISNRFMIYMGPNEYNTLDAYDKGLQKQMDLGWSFISYINIGTVYLFNFLEKYISSYGLIIIILALIIRMLVLPMTYKSHVSMAKMRVINQTPEIKAIDEKHKDDPQKAQMEKMKIFRQMNVSMFGGCLPMLFSYPFLIALFFFFPQSVELRQQSFLWSHDLSTYDSVLDLPFSIPAYGDHVSLFCLLMAISTFVYTIFQQRSQPTQTGPAAQMKYIAYFMPVVLLIFLNNYASGLSLYYLTSNIITILQTTIIRSFVNDDKLLADMEAARKAKSKKGKGGKGNSNDGSKSRIERWVEKQQKKQDEMRKAQQKAQAKNRKMRRN